MCAIDMSKEAPWLLLIFSLPAREASKRVEVWRRLQKYGALALSSAYVLPNTSSNHERFEWLAALIRDSKGKASVVRVQAIDDLPSPALRRMFLAARSSEYEAVAQEVGKLLRKSKRPAGKVSALRRRIQEIAAVDFFDSPLRSRVDALLARAESEVPADHPQNMKAAKMKKEYRGRTWVTRPRPGIDRVSSAWLIRRFIDPKAKFIFAKDARQHTRAIPFDMFGSGGFGHRGDDCTFETLVKQFDLSESKLATLAKIIHDADLADEKFGRTEGLAIERVLIGWAQPEISDDELVRRGMELIEGLYCSIR